MGQYWLIINLTKKQYLLRKRYNSGAKLMEFSWMDNAYIRGMQALIQPGGLWHGDKVWIEGDYNEPNPDVNLQTNIYSLAYEYWQGVQIKELPQHKKFAINLTKKCFVQIKKPSDKKYKIHPLPLLLAKSTGGGGGDYRGRNQFLLGQWAGDVVYTDDTVPSGFLKFKASFYEGGSDQEDDQVEEIKQKKKQQKLKYASFFQGQSDDLDSQDQQEEEENEFSSSASQQSQKDSEEEQQRFKNLKKKKKSAQRQIITQRQNDKKISKNDKKTVNKRVNERERERSRDKHRIKSNQPQNKQKKSRNY